MNHGHVQVPAGSKQCLDAKYCEHSLIAEIVCSAHAALCLSALYSPPGWANLGWPDVDTTVCNLP